MGFKGVYIAWTCFPDGKRAYLNININFAIIYIYIMGVHYIILLMVPLEDL